MAKAINLKSVMLTSFILIILSILIWQGIYFQGSPDPTEENLSQTAATLNTAILVFREGLEAILVLSAIISGLIRKKQTNYWKPISIGAGVSFVAILITWFVVVTIISAVNAPELAIQAATGLLAVIVLLIIMNWFFHKIYWTGWINLHNRKKQQLTEQNNGSNMFWSLFLLGLTSIYREGFEVVLFLQNLRLKVGSDIVLQGTLIGLILTMIVGVLTFFAHARLPYKKMLVFTGALLVVVLAVMMGETVQEMQLAKWIPTTEIPVTFPDWMGVWFCISPTVETLSSQVLAVIYVLGSYFAARYITKRKASKQLASNF